MKDFKIGDKVKLDKSTKPYTYKLGNEIAKIPFNLRDEVHNISHVLDDGDVAIMNSFGGEVSIHPKHLTHVEEEFNEHLYELRLDIFKTNPSLSVSEMQEIEKWLLNK